jgi:hypothetical protein
MKPQIHRNNVYKGVSSYLTGNTLRLRNEDQPVNAVWGTVYFFVRTIRNTQIIYKNSVRTSQETHHVSATKPNRLMLFWETVAVCCENHTEHTKADGTDNNHRALKPLTVVAMSCVRHRL